MFILAFLAAGISYEVFFIGILGLLKTGIVFAVVLLTIAIVIFWKRNDLLHFLYKITRIPRGLSFLEKTLIVVLIAQIIVNMIGALGPELAFDALWYHLTLPKLYLISGSVMHIPGGLLYYSDMPKLGEMLYTMALSLHGEIVAKVFHLLFGLLTVLSVYLVARRNLPRTYALLAALIFYGNLVVAWESTTAYIDLIRAFYEIMALWAFLLWNETKKGKWFYSGALLVGSAIATKQLALFSLAVFAFLISLFSLRKHESLMNLMGKELRFIIVALIIPLPWFLFSYIHTGNPLYPVFSPIFGSIYKTSYNTSLLNPARFIADSWHLFTHAADPLSPLYVILLPGLMYFFRSFRKELRIIILYSLSGFLSWYILPRTGGGRYILAYLPAFSVLAGAVVSKMNEERILGKFTIGLVIVISLITIGYRGIANARYLPVILGRESKQAFLTTHLNFSFGDFYDTDNYFAIHIKPTDNVLLYGFHNLYYIDFPFIDASWVKKGNRFNYIATQGTSLPNRFMSARRVYSNRITKVSLYKLGKMVSY